MCVCVCIGLHIKYLLLLPELNENLNFPTQISNFMKILPVRAEYFPWGQTDGRTDGRADMAKLIVEFRNFAKAP